MPSFNYRGLNAPVPTPTKRQLAKASLGKLSKSKQPISKPPNPVFKRVCRHYSDDFKLVLVALHFGSLTDLSNPVRTAWSIARELNLSDCVVSRACRNYKALGVVSVKWKRPGQTRKYSPELLDAMISPRALDEQKFLSLQERCDMLWEKHGLQVGPHALRGLYKRKGIGHRFSRTQVSEDSALFFEHCCPMAPP